MDQPFEEELCGASALDRSVGRPILMAACFAAVAVLGFYGLYQGFRFTWRDYGTAPSYSQAASPPSPAAPETQAANDESPPPTAKPKVELADNDVAPPTPDGPQAATITPIVPIDRASLVPAASSAQQGVTLDPPAGASLAAPAPDQPQ